MQNKNQFLSQFKGYPSLELSTNTKFIKTIYQSNFDDPQILWVATQKIHGSNFSIAYDLQNNLVRYCRRNDFISKEIPVPVEDITPYFTQNFFDAAQVINTFHNKLIKIKQNVNKKYQNIKGINIYGEYFGGFWHEKAQCKKRVQLGVYYTPDHQFMVFDIKLTSQNHHTWVEVTQIPNVLDDVIKCIPIYRQGTLQELLKVNCVIDSTIPSLLGLKHVQNNICEGLIIRPNKNLFSKNRVVLKKKNQQFLEKVGQSKVKKQVKKVQKGEADPFIDLLQQFLNVNRVQSAISKYPDFEDNFHLKGYVIEDILQDAKKQGYEVPQNPRLQKQIRKKFDRIAFQFVTEYLQEQRKQFANKIKK